MPVYKNLDGTTPDKGLFSETVRAYSHGCMRVQNPERFAEIILRRDKGWSPARVESTFGAGDEYRVALTPAGAHELSERGHEVLVQEGAGVVRRTPIDSKR